MKAVMAGLLSLAVCLSGAAAADLPSPPFGQEVEGRLVATHTIYISITGCVTGDFVTACHIFQSTNVLTRIDAAYKAQLPKGEKSDFTIQSTTNGHFYCINMSKERSELYDVCCRGGANSNYFERVMYVQGERNFGMFESLLAMRIFPAKGSAANVLTYEADVYVYPHCMALRIFLKICPGVKRYFRREAEEMECIMTGVFGRLMKSQGGVIGHCKRTASSTNQDEK